MIAVRVLASGGQKKNPKQSNLQRPIPLGVFPGCPHRGAVSLRVVLYLLRLVLSLFRSGVAQLPFSLLRLPCSSPFLLPFSRDARWCSLLLLGDSVCSSAAPGFWVAVSSLRSAGRLFFTVTGPLLARTFSCVQLRTRSLHDSKASRIAPCVLTRLVKCFCVVM